jgi:excisionase family DNA binding protein
MIESPPPQLSPARVTPDAVVDRPFLSISQAASMLGVSRVTIWRWIRAGRLRATRLGQRATRIERESLMRALTEQRADGARAWHVPASEVGVATTVWQHRRLGPETSEHIVQFYESDAYLIDSLTTFVEAGIRGGQAVIVVATQSHCEALDLGLFASGLDLATLRERGQLVMLDAASTLAQLMVDGVPDADRFDAIIGGLVRAAVARFGGLRAFGEMVGLLALAGKFEEAIQLERLWNGLQEGCQFSLLCAYSMDKLGGSASADLLDGVCATHSQVIPTERYTSLSTEDEKLRAIALLQQKAQTLEDEIAERRRAEQALKSLLRVGEKLHASLDLDTLLDQIVVESLALVGAEGGCAGLNTAAGMVCKSYVRAAETIPLVYCWPAGHGLPGWILLHKVPYITNDASADDQIVQDLWVEFGVRSAISTPILDTQGEVLGFFQLHNKVDGSAFTRADQERLVGVAQIASVAIQNARLYRAEQDAVDVRDEFLSIASHELRTPLTTVKAMAQLMLRRLARGDTLDAASIERAFTGIAEQSSKLTRLIEQLLDVSRLEGGKLRLDSDTVDLRQLIDRIVAAASVRSEQSIRVLGPESLLATVDLLRLDQVVTNLVDNAIKYGASEASIDVEVARPSADRIEIAVRDRGPGIPESMRPGIFERFFQAHPDGHKSGMGLGLYIGRQIVELHGGEIWAEFPTDGGTRFVISLPNTLASSEQLPSDGDLPATLDRAS